MTAHFVIEISKSKNRIYILAIKIPEKYINLITTGKKPVDLIGTHYLSKMQAINLTEKQAKRVLTECDNDFKTLVDLL
jgi:hypothetical protein